MSGALPPGFESLEPFVERWCLPSSDARSLARGDCEPEERERFYAAAHAAMAEALDHLDRKPLDAFDARDEKLMKLMLSLCHVALAVELQRDQEAYHSALRRFMPITRSSADSGRNGGAV